MSMLKTYDKILKSMPHNADVASFKATLSKTRINKEDWFNIAKDMQNLGLLSVSSRKIKKIK